MAKKKESNIGSEHIGVLLGLLLGLLLFGGNFKETDGDNDTRRKKETLR